MSGRLRNITTADTERITHNACVYGAHIYTYSLCVVYHIKHTILSNSIIRTFLLYFNSSLCIKEPKKKIDAKNSSVLCVARLAYTKQYNTTQQLYHTVSYNIVWSIRMLFFVWIAKNIYIYANRPTHRNHWFNLGAFISLVFGYFCCCCCCL